MAQSKAAVTTGRWQAVGGREGGTVTSLAMSPDFPADGVVFAGTLAGLHRSTDGGKTWAGSGSGLRSPFIEAVAVSPAFSRDHTVVAGARNAGMWMSVDGGDSWYELQIWGNRLSVTAAALSPDYASDSTMLVGTEGPATRARLGRRSTSAFLISLASVSPSRRHSQLTRPSSRRPRQASTDRPTAARLGAIPARGSRGPRCSASPSRRSSRTTGSCSSEPRSTASSVPAVAATTGRLLARASRTSASPASRFRLISARTAR
jgi:hypothetical protein